MYGAPVDMDTGPAAIEQVRVGGKWELGAGPPCRSLWPLLLQTGRLEASWHSCITLSDACPFALSLTN